VPEAEQNILYTVGHSNHSTEEFIGLLKRHRIEVVADVRSAPYSRYCPQFNKDVIASSLQVAGIGYIFLGKELGGRPDEESCYKGGRVDFRRVAEREEFKEGLERLLAESLKHCVALMCAEKDPLRCHRTFLIARHLGRELCIKHILEDGSIEEHAEAERRMVRMLKVEPSLFGAAETEEELIERAYDQQGRFGIGG